MLGVLLLFVVKVRIRVGGVGGVAPLGPEGSALVVAPPTYTNHCGGRVLGRRGHAGHRRSALPPTHTPVCVCVVQWYWEDVK